MKTTNLNETNLIIILVCGLLVFIGYSKMFMASESELNDLWTNKGKNSVSGKVLTGYKIMISIAFIVGVLLSLYMIFYNPIKYPHLFMVGLVLLLVPSVVWAWQPFVYSEIVLFLAGLGAILLTASFAIEAENNKDYAAVAGGVFLVIQTFILDFIFWTGLVVL